jgi:phosphate starvation-inducible PhoH-like protein
MAKKKPSALSQEIEGPTKISQSINFKHRAFKLSEKQKALLEIMLREDTKVVFVAGPAGVAKTFVSVMAALNILSKNKDSQILYIRSIAESAEKGLGSLPGEVEDKFCPFTAPLYDKIEELISPEHVVWLKKNNAVVAMPINYLRGASWLDKIVIADEQQNCSFKELTTLITRIGEGTKLFICGDFMQADIKNSGFESMFNIFSTPDCAEQGIHTFKFGTEDIVRSGILRFIVSKLEQAQKQRLTA